MKSLELKASKPLAFAKAAPFVLRLLTLLPVALVIVLIIKFRVHFWQLDCQRIIKIATDTLQGGGSWLHWLDHVNGHRLPVTMALYGVVGTLTHWNGTAWIVVTLVLAAGCWVALRSIVQGTVSDPLKRSWILMIGSWVFFSPLRVSNWMMSWGIMWPLLEFLLFSGLAIALSRKFSWRARNILCGVLALLGSHTLLHGLLFWGVFPLALYGAASADKRTVSRNWWLGWIGAGLLVGASYFNFGLTPIKTWGDAESSVASLFTGLAGSASAVLKFGFQLLTAFGTPVGPTVAGISTAGVVPLVLVISVLVCAIINDRFHWLKSREGAIWAALLLLGFSGILLIVIGRHRLSWMEGYSTTSRYHFASLLLMLGSTGLALMMRKRWRIAGWVFAVGLACCHWIATAASVSVYPETRAVLARDRATFAYEVAWGAYRGFAPTATTLSGRHVYPVTVEAPEDLLARIKSIRQGPPLAGGIDSVTVNVKSGHRIVHGWSESADPTRKPDAIAVFQLEPEVKLMGLSGTPEHSQPASDFRNQTGREASGWTVPIPSEVQRSSVLAACVIDGARGVVQVSVTLGIDGKEVEANGQFSESSGH